LCGGTFSLSELSNRLGGESQVAVDEDFECVSLCQRGDIEAFRVLVDKYQRKMLNMAYRILGDYEAACEVVQDAFLSAHKSIRKFRGDAKFSTWLYRIVINISRNRMKQLKTRLFREGISLDDAVRNEERQSSVDPPVQMLSALEQLERKELQAIVQECISLLDDEHREVLVLRDIQGFSYDEIKDILNIPDGTVKSRLFRARDLLRGSLKKVLGDL
jgi:RNA polymerase sigma-70 factor (ECF subfamily)